MAGNCSWFSLITPSFVASDTFTFCPIFLSKISVVAAGHCRTCPNNPPKYPVLPQTQLEMAWLLIKNVLFIWSPQILCQKTYRCWNCLELLSWWWAASYVFGAPFEFRLYFIHCSLKLCFFNGNNFSLSSFFLLLLDLSKKMLNLTLNWASASLQTNLFTYLSRGGICIMSLENTTECR